MQVYGPALSQSNFSIPSEFWLVYNNANYNIGGLHITSSKHDYANYDQFAPIFVVVYKTIQHVSVPNLNLFGPTKTELRAKEVGKFSIM